MISAGVVMNLIFGLIFFIICFQMGVKFPAAVVGDVQPLSPAATTYARGHENDPRYLGLQAGDRIVSANGNPVEDMTGVKIATALGKAGRPVELTVDRDGEDKQLTFAVIPRPDRQQEMLLSAGIAPSPTLRVVQVLGKTPFAEAGAKAGMTITAVDGRSVETFGEYAKAFDDADGQTVTVTLTGEDGNTIDVPVAPEPAFRTSTEQQNLAGLIPATQIVAVSEDAPAEAAGVLADDLIAQINDVNWPTIDQVMQATRAADSDGVQLKVMRGDELVDIGSIHPSGGMIGIALSLLVDDSRIGQVAEGSPLHAANLPGGSRITEINGTAVSNWSELQQALARVGDSEQAGRAQVTAQVNLANQPTEQFEITLSPEQVEQVQFAGWSPPRSIGLDDLLVDLKAQGPIESAVIGVRKTKEFIQQTYITLLRLFQGSIGVKNLRGPVGIVDEGSKVASRGLAYYLFFLGLISVNLAVLNFLPIPIVDGGLMVFLLIEKLKGSPASPKVQVAVSLVGLVGLACVFLYVTFNDIQRLVAG